MSEKPTRFNKGVRLKPKTSAPTLEGEITVDSADDKIKAYLDSAERAVVTEDQAATLTNKTIDSASNTITIDADEATVSELETDNFKTGVIDTDGTLAANSDTKIPTQQAVKEYVDAQILTTDDASEITYTPAVLTDWDGDIDPGNVDGALDQLAERVDDNEIAIAAKAESSTVTEIDANVDDLITLSGVAENATDLGTFTGTTITDAQTVKSALQELETSLETKAAVADLTETDTNTDDLVTLSGVAENSTSLGTFTGTTIADNETVKGALQDLETEVETKASSTDLTSHTGASSEVHGVTGSVVGTTDAQTLTNKTLDGTTTHSGIIDHQEESVSGGTAVEADITIAKENVRLTGTPTGLRSVVAVSGGRAVIINKTGSTVPVRNEDGAATAANRIITGAGVDIDLDNNASIILQYNDTDSRWHIVGGTGSGTVDATDVTYTPTTLTDWDGDADPGNVDDALDQLAERVDDNELAISTNSTNITSNDTDIRELQTKVEYNYIANPDAEVDTTGWTVYANTSAGTSPDDFGGTPNGSFTWTRSTSTPLVGDASFLLTKPAANVQGNGIYYQFTAENGHLAKKLLLSILTDTSLLDDGDLRIYLVSSSDSFSADFNVISPANPEVLAGTPDIFKQFQFDASDTAYRLCLHYASTDTTAKTAKFDQIVFGDRPVATSAFVSDWEEYTPTFNGMGTVSNSFMYYRRVGDSLEVRGRFVTGTVTASDAYFTIPSGINIDDTISVTSTVVGRGTRSVSGSNLNDFSIIHRSSQNTRLYIGALNQSAFNPFSNTAADGIMGSSESIAVFATVPIAGWSSNAKSSEDLGSREIYFKAYRSANYSVSGTDQTVQFNTEVEDTTASYDNSTYTFTVPESGKYQFNVGIEEFVASPSTGDSYDVWIKVNSDRYKIFRKEWDAAPGQTVQNMQSGSRTFDLIKGDTVSVSVDEGVTPTWNINGGESRTYFEGFKLASPQTILETETVAARYTYTGGAVADGSNIPFDTSDGDTHNAMNTSTGEYTIPVSGWYNVSMNTRPTSSVATAFDIYKNGSQIVRAFNGGATDDSIGCTSNVNFTKGDVVTVKNATGVSRTLTGGFQTNFSIARIK